MYGNMTREEMITRLYEGNFTTGELERQLIAKLFEQCCGGGGSSSGETFVVEIQKIADDKKFNKTAKEVFDACETSNVIFVETKTETDPDYGLMTIRSIYSLAGAGYVTGDLGLSYAFKLIGPDSNSTNIYMCHDGNEYPVAIETQDVSSGIPLDILLVSLVKKK